MSTFETEPFTRIITPESFETAQLPNLDWSSAEVSPNPSGSLGLGVENLFGLEPGKSRKRVLGNNTNHEKPQRDCLSRVLQQQEDVCINLLWAARGMTSVPAAEMLQCLKRGIETYDELLECRSHPVPPELISVFMSTCEIMVVGVEHLVLKLRGDEGHDPAIEQRNPAHQKGQLKPRATASENPGVKTQHATKPGSAWQQPRSKLGKLVLDGDDEFCVLHSLLAFRTRRLVSLVERLHGVADKNGRPVHIRLIHNFRERCQAALSSLESERKLYMC